MRQLQDPGSAKLRRAAGDLRAATALAGAGTDPRGRAEYGALNSQRLISWRAVVDALQAPPTEDLASAAEDVSEAFGSLRRWLVSATGELFDVMAEIYDDRVESEAAIRVARTRLARVVRTRRLERGLTLDEVAKSVGVTASYISQIEFGRTLPRQERAVELDRTLGLVGDANAESSAQLVLAELADRRQDIRRDAQLIGQRRDRRVAHGVESAGPPHALRALSSWTGTELSEDIAAIEILAAQPSLRAVVTVLHSLPAQTQARAVEFLLSLRDVAAPATATRRPRVDLEAVHAAQKDTPVRSWELSSLVLELAEVFDPFSTDPASDREARYGAAATALQARGFDVAALVGGPILRRAARLVVDQARVQTQWDLTSLPKPLAEWAVTQTAESRSAAMRILWSFWAGLAVDEALPWPTPSDVAWSPPRVDPMIDWFYSRCTDSSFKSWTRASLNFEREALTNQRNVESPWAAALTIWQGDVGHVDRELQRRRQSSDGAESDSTADLIAGNMLITAYRAFLEGRRDVALARAREVLELFPGAARAHNNLGFLMLGDAAYNDALVAFDRAAELGYDEKQILDFNRACAHYMVASYESALAGFRGCFAELTSRASVLYLIDGDALVPIEVGSATAYIGLAALNAGWSAMRAGLRGFAIELLEIARTGSDAFEEEPTAMTGESATSSFQRSRIALERETSRQPTTESALVASD